MAMPSRKLSEDDVEHLFHDKHLVVSGKASIATILFLAEKIQQLEKTIHKVAKLKDEYTLLMTVPGHPEDSGPDHHV